MEGVAKFMSRSLHRRNTTGWKPSLMIIKSVLDMFHYVTFQVLTAESMGYSGALCSRPTFQRCVLPSPSPWWWRQSNQNFVHISYIAFVLCMPRPSLSPLFEHPKLCSSLFPVCYLLSSTHCSLASPFRVLLLMWGPSFTPTQQNR
jgi:hypothetical protein